jgi:hypothetical protein
MYLFTAGQKSKLFIIRHILALLMDEETNEINVFQGHGVLFSGDAISGPSTIE